MQSSTSFVPNLRFGTSSTLDRCSSRNIKASTSLQRGSTSSSRSNHFQQTLKSKNTSTSLDQLARHSKNLKIRLSHGETKVPLLSLNKVNLEGSFGSKVRTGKDFVISTQLKFSHSRERKILLKFKKHQIFQLNQKRSQGNSLKASFSQKPVLKM